MSEAPPAPPPPTLNITSGLQAGNDEPYEQPEKEPKKSDKKKEKGKGKSKGKSKDHHKATENRSEEEEKIYPTIDTPAQEREIENESDHEESYPAATQSSNVNTRSSSSVPANDQQDNSKRAPMPLPTSVDPESVEVPPLGEIRPRYPVDFLIPRNIICSFIPSGSHMSDQFSLRRKQMEEMCKLKENRMKKIEKEMNENEKLRDKRKEKMEKENEKKYIKIVEKMKKERKKAKNPMTGDEIQGEIKKYRDTYNPEIVQEIARYDKELYETVRKNHLEFIKELHTTHLQHVEAFFSLARKHLQREQENSLKEAVKCHQNEIKEELKKIHDNYKYEEKIRKREMNPITQTEIETAATVFKAKIEQSQQDEISRLERKYRHDLTTLQEEEHEFTEYITKHFTNELNNVPSIDHIVRENRRKTEERQAELHAQAVELRRRQLEAEAAKAAQTAK